VPRHVARLVTRLVTPLVDDFSTSRRLVVNYSTSRRLVVDYSTSRRLLVSMSVMLSFIYFKVLVKRTLSPLPLSNSTLLSLEPATIGFRTRGKCPGSEKLVH
jgi:hypothetical protein